MQVFLTSTDFQTALAEFQQQTGAICQLDDCESVLILSSTLGQGRVSRVNLREGLDLLINEHVLENSLAIAHQDDSSGSSPVVLKFFLSGRAAGSIQGVSDSIYGASGDYCFVYCPGRRSSVEFAEGDKNFTLELDIAADVFLTMMDEGADFEQFQQILEAKTFEPYFRSGKTTPLMAVALQQILQCPYQGATRRLYLESKGLELIALYLGQFNAHQPNPQKSNPLKPEDLGQIYRARDILIRQMDNPPSLLSLARQVGINDRKLKQGFRQAFGTTVFGYLHDRRMERAAQLLQANQTSVSGVARAVGFVHRGYFAAAFKRKFGVNPRDYLAAYRKQYWDLQQNSPASDRENSG